MRAPGSPPVGVVVIGASTGGVEALTRLLPALPAGLAAPVCIVLHLPPQAPSLLVQIFAGRCSLPVTEVEDGEPLLDGTVYFGAPNYHFLIEPGPRVALSIDDPVHFSRPSVDLLLQSAADVYRAAAMGVLLSGSNADGAEGLEAIVRAGGVALIQDPGEAQAPELSRAALECLPGHPVMNLGEIAAALAGLPTRMES